MPMIGIYPVLGFGNSIANLENRRQTGGSLIGSIGELYNEIEKSIQAGFQKKILLKDSKGNMDEANYDLLHKKRS
jgi:hypothetical protein